jgi:hypothetical protein
VAWVIKIGGSLSARARPLRRLMAALGEAGRAQRLVVVPGGGPLADVVRRLDRRFALGDTAAHWMAILAMDQYAHLLARLAGDAVIVRSPRELRAGRLNVLAPSAWLQRADPLPHSWSVTSDAIAAWVARELRAGGLVVVKDVDGLLASARPGRPARLRPRVARHRVAGVVDPAFPEALGSRRPCWIVSGLHPERVVTLLRTGRSVGTELV